MKNQYTINVDFELLRKQKLALLELMPFLSSECTDALQGIISIIDEIQDQAVDVNGVSEELVFGKDKEES